MNTKAPRARKGTLAPFSTLVIRFGGQEVRVDGEGREDCVRQLLQGARDADALVAKKGKGSE